MNNSIESNSTAKHNFDELESVFRFMVFLIPFGLIILGMNAVALRVFLRERFRSKKSSYLIVNLTIADSLVGLTSVLLCVCLINLIKGSEGRLELDILRGLLFTIRLSAIASLLSLSAIAVERLIAVKYPFKLRLASSRHYFGAIFVVWILAAPTPVIWMLERERIILNNGSRIFNQITEGISLAIIALCYLCIWIKMAFFPEFNIDIQTNNCRTVKENKKLTITLFIITVISIITWAPNGIKDLLLSDETQQQQMTLKDLLFLLPVLSNSIFNVIVYAFRMPDFRRELKKVFPVGRND
ncbi:melatonin receptor type 1A-like [Exaiptasia diaphana]|uniref:G-protein coupled receptors family 1 profile domain-containing protein n=1 Tax=Exaiptasia diaphana TaxID=2652724 RepID=A0A913WUZ9_EXADI|nr:melatonin receptor type 1A-like [Exaiptasia diaphana]